MLKFSSIITLRTLIFLLLLIAITDVASAQRWRRKKIEYGLATNFKASTSGFDFSQSIEGVLRVGSMQASAGLLVNYTDPYFLGANINYRWYYSDLIYGFSRDFKNIDLYLQAGFNWRSSKVTIYRETLAIEPETGDMSIAYFPEKSTVATIEPQVIIGGRYSVGRSFYIDLGLGGGYYANSPLKQKLSSEKGSSGFGLYGNLGVGYRFK